MTEQASKPRTYPRSFHVVLKPLGARCNLDCTYCYYRHRDDVPVASKADRISDELLEEFTRQYISNQDLDPVRFNWHGGEPTLLGLDFYRKALQLQEKYAGTRQIENELQTNGVLLDKSWCDFLKEHRFYVGLSLDGPKELHDRFRLGKGGRPSFDQVMRAARLLQEYDVPFNILTVINSVNARHPAEVYGFLTKELGCQRLQWLPCVEPTCFRTTAPGSWNPDWMPTAGTPAAKPGQPGSVVTDWSVDPDDWGEFLIRTFDLWFTTGLGKILVNWFESLVGQWMGQPAQICSLGGICGRSLVTMDKDGSLYSCDHFVYSEHRLGKLGEDGRQLVDYVYSDRQRAFGCGKQDSLPDYCRRCRYYFACHGECPKNRFIRTPDGQPGLNYLCSGIRRFLAYAEPYLQQIVGRLHGSVSVQSTDQMPVPVLKDGVKTRVP